MGKEIGNFWGAFADGAILFPLIATLSSSSGYSSTVLFFTAGVLYILAGLYFKIPMPVQPLKAISVAAVVNGASFTEVRLAGALIGLFCLGLLFFHVEKFSNRIPTFLIHGIQLGLGCMLIRKAIDSGIPLFYHPLDHVSLVILMAVVASLIASKITSFSTLGLLAAMAALFAISQNPISSSNSHFIDDNTVRWNLILTLVLPQIILTMANSVIATPDAAKRYFGDKASKVTLRSLLTSLGIGNILMSLIGGLPFCHGSGGMTAHVRGGSYHGRSNFYIGLFLIVLSAIQYFSKHIVLVYPPLFLCVLLGTVGFYHLQLAKPSWNDSNARVELIAMGATAFLTQNLIDSLLAGVIIAFAKPLFFARKVSNHDLLS